MEAKANETKRHVNLNRSVIEKLTADDLNGIVGARFDAGVRPDTDCTTDAPPGGLPQVHRR